MARRTSNKPSAFERTYKVLEYLKKNTDSNHTVTQVQLTKAPELKPYMGTTDTNNTMISNMANTMNSDEFGHINPKEEWRIIFDHYAQEYDCDDDNSAKPFSSKGLYYKHIFSYDEINLLIEGILFSKTLDTKLAHHIIDKIEKNLTTKFYKQKYKNICTVRDTVLANREVIRQNLLLIQQAIDNRVQISFQFNKYNYKKEIIPVRNKRNTASPYYIVANSGKYYMLAGCGDDPSMFIWRVDLMTDLKIEETPAPDKKDVKNLPQQWDETFPMSHINMSFDLPRTITLRVLSETYTFLYDWFGDTFTYERTEEEAPYGDIVRVRCSEFGIINWALQYSDRVEVLDPPEIREKIIEKIINLNKKYGLEK